MSTELAEALEDLDGFRWAPGIAKILDGVTEIREAVDTGELSADATQILLSLFGNPCGPDLQYLHALIVQVLTGPDNKALDHLPSRIRKDVQGLGALHGFETAKYAIRDHTNEAAGLITGA